MTQSRPSRRDGRRLTESALWIRVRPQAALADAQGSDDALPRPVHRDRATELTGYAAGNHLAAEARGFVGSGNGWPATFGPDNDFAVLFSATTSSKPDVAILRRVSRQLVDDQSQRRRRSLSNVYAPHALHEISEASVMASPTPTVQGRRYASGQGLELGANYKKPLLRSSARLIATAALAPSAIATAIRRTSRETSPAT